MQAGNGSCRRRGNIKQGAGMKIAVCIKQVPDPEGQIILEERYLRMVKWEQIAATLNMSMRKVFRLHDETLKKIMIPESWQ